jgi:hypothetical protein
MTPHVRQHYSGHLTRARTLIQVATVLCSDGNRRGRALIYGLAQVHIGRTHGDFYRATNTITHQSGQQFGNTFPRAMHFPIPDNEWLTHIISRPKKRRQS